MKEFWQIDCFTNEPFCGNPAAVVFDCDDKSSQWMQAVSREMNLSETVFFVKPTRQDADYRVRFFTPRRELPFAGHPTIAAVHAFLEKYRAHDAAGVRAIRQECEAGIIPIEVRAEASTRVYVMQQRSPEYRNLTTPPEYYAGLLGCDCSALERGPVQVVSTGVPWVIVQLIHEEAVDSLAPRFVEIERECRAEKAVGVTVFALGGTESSRTARVRTFAPGEGVMEDPVCGSGNGAVGAYAAMHLFPDEASFQYRAVQGHKVNRPGEVLVQCRRDDWKSIHVYVGGAAVKVLDGTIHA